MEFGFNQNLWVNGAVKYIDALIRAVEAQGGQALAVFHYRFMDQVVGNMGADQVSEQFFCQDGKTIIDALLSPMMFSLGMASERYQGILERLDVPVVQAVSTMQPVEQWRDSPQGLTAMDVTMSLAQPEFDGNLISAPVASKQQTKRDPGERGGPGGIPAYPRPRGSVRVPHPELGRPAAQAQSRKARGHHFPPLPTTQRPHRLRGRPGQLCQRAGFVAAHGRGGLPAGGHLSGRGTYWPTPCWRA